jgi:hypothetical protein
VEVVARMQARIAIVKDAKVRKRWLREARDLNPGADAGNPEVHEQSLDDSPHWTNGESENLGVDAVITWGARPETTNVTREGARDLASWSGCQCALLLPGVSSPRPNSGS